jgi:FAD/FMN-containing dehydrogenase
LRGGGGNFGVVTGFEYKLHEAGPEIIGGLIAWRGEDAREVLKMYRTVIEQAPPEFSCASVVRKAPPAPWLSKDIHGKLMVALIVCHTGSIEEGERLMKTIRSFGSPVGDIVQRRTYVSQQSILDATQPKGRSYYWKSDFLPGLTPDLLESVIAHGERVMSPHSGVFLFPLGNTLARLPEDYSAAGNRDATFVFNVAASWEKPEDDELNIQWARSAWQDLRRFSTGRASINFQTEEENVDRIHATYGSNYTRLVDVKRKWDPRNLFRTNKNIAPPA